MSHIEKIYRKKQIDMDVTVCQMWLPKKFQVTPDALTTIQGVSFLFAAPCTVITDISHHWLDVFIDLFVNSSSSSSWGMSVRYNLRVALTWLLDHPVCLLTRWDNSPPVTTRSLAVSFMSYRQTGYCFLRTSHCEAMMSVKAAHSVWIRHWLYSTVHKRSVLPCTRNLCTVTCMIMTCHWIKCSVSTTNACKFFVKSNQHCSWYSNQILLL